MSRFVLEGPRPCTIFCVVLIHYAMNYVTKTFILVSSSERIKQLFYFVHGQGQKAVVTKLSRTSNFVGPCHHEALLFSG